MPHLPSAPEPAAPQRDRCRTFGNRLHGFHGFYHLRMLLLAQGTRPSVR